MKCSIPPHIDKCVRFSYATNMSRPQESGYMQATYKKRKHVKNIPFDATTRGKQHVRVVQW